MVGGVASQGSSFLTGNILQYLMGFLAIVGAFLIFLGFLSGSTSMVLMGGIIIVMALLMFVLMAILGMFGAAKEGVQTARQVKDLVDEVAPGAIPAAQRGVRRGLDAVTGKRPLLGQQQPYAQQQYAQQPNAQQQQYAQEQPYAQQQAPPPEAPPQAVRPLYYPCPTCGAGNPPGEAYCHYCKRPLKR